MFTLLITLLLTLLPPLVAAENLIPKAPKIHAKSYILVDVGSGSVIAEKNSQKKLAPASLTKMMTAYIASHQLHNGNLQLSDTVTISHKAWKAEGSRMFVEVNSQVPVTDILHGIIIQSGNDASIALAEHIADTESNFALLMNEFAKKLDMPHTNFKNATGLPHKDHYTTAADIATLAIQSIQNFPDTYAIYAKKHYTYNNIKQFNRNKLLWLDPSVDGLKTGHTQAAGYSLVSSAKRDKTRLIAVVMGAKSNKARITASKKLLNYGFRYFETYNAFNKDEEIRSVKVWGGNQNYLKLTVADKVDITMMRGKKHKIKTTISVDKYISTPIKAGDQHGEITITLGEQTLAVVPLIAQQAVEDGNFLKMLWHQLLLMFCKLLNINHN